MSDLTVEEWRGAGGTGPLPGPDLDQLLSRSLLDWKREIPDIRRQRLYDKRILFFTDSRQWRPSKSFGQAWRLLDLLVDYYGFEVTVFIETGNGARITLVPIDDQPGCNEVFGTSLPHGACLAVLAAMGVET